MTIASPETWAQIAAPLPSESISWRIDSKPKSRDGKYFARFVCYVEAGTVRERLDSVVPGQWQLTVSPFGEMVSFVQHEGTETVYAVVATLTIMGITRECIGQGDDLKQAATDAFKRAAVRFGIGHELYNMEQNWVEVDGDGKFAKAVEDPQTAYERRYQRSGAKAAAKPSVGLEGSDTPAVAASPVPPGTPAHRTFLMPFGKTKGKRLMDLPDKEVSGALDWAKEKGKFNEFQSAAAQEMDFRRTPVTANGSSFDDFPDALRDFPDNLPF